MSSDKRRMKEWQALVIFGSVSLLLVNNLLVSSDLPLKDVFSNAFISFPSASSSATTTAAAEKDAVASSMSSLGEVPSTGTISTNNNGNSALVDGELECFADDNDGATAPLPRVPTFLIAGAQKAGTTALYYLLEKIPGIEPSINFETHFFDQRGGLGQNASALTAADVCRARQNFLSFFAHNGSFPYNASLPTPHDQPEHRISFEKTPIYLCKPEIPALIRKVTPWTKVIILLRNPVDRAYSMYKMMRQRAVNETEVPSFEVYVNQQVTQLRRAGLSRAPTLQQFTKQQNRSQIVLQLSNEFALDPRVNFATRMDRKYNWFWSQMLPRGMYAQQLSSWLKHYSVVATTTPGTPKVKNAAATASSSSSSKLPPQLLLIQYEAFAANRSAVLNDILRFVGYTPPAPTQQQSAAHPHGSATGHGLDHAILNDAYNPTRGIKRNYTVPIQPTTREYLEHFYAPYNAELARLLGNEEWRNVWW